VTTRSSSESGLPSASTAVPGLVPIEELLAQLVDRAHEVIGAQDRLRHLLDANRIIVGELSLPMVLRRIVEAARDLVGAEYCALGVIGADGLLEQFVNVGMDEATVRAIGELPKGRGVLGALIETPHPIRLRRISDDERSSGFPPGHPEMTSFLGVPIRSGDTVYGNLYLTNHREGSFSADDEALVGALAATAGGAIENARLYGEARHRQQWLLASAEITAALLNPTEEREPMRLIADSVLHLADADVAILVLPAASPDFLDVVVAAGEAADQLTGRSYPKAKSLVELALQTGRGVRVGRLEDHHDLGVHLREVVRVSAVMAVPMLGKSGPHGAIIAGRRPGRHPFGSAELEMAEAFANQAAVAQELATARVDQQRLTLLEDRDRIARDLHDHVIQRLFAAGLIVQSVATGEADFNAAQRLSHVVAELDDTIKQVRTSIFHLRGTSITGPGLRSALLTVIAQIEPALGFSPTVQFGGPVDTVTATPLVAEAEAVVREALTNVAKHADAAAASLLVIATEDRLVIDVIDNGMGFSESTRRSGLDNLARRAADLTGSLTVEPASDGGTQLRWTVPLNP
jgi:signal transduction histidine kinase